MHKQIKFARMLESLRVTVFTTEESLATLADALGMSFDEVEEVFNDATDNWENETKNDAYYTHIRDLADNQLILIDGDLEMEGDALVSESPDGNGAYVETWSWVSFAGTHLDKEKTESEEEEDGTDIYVCGDCGYEASVQKFPPAQDLLQRLEVGDVFTDKECPECGALSHPKP